MNENLLLFVIVGCEIAFWVVLFTGLLVRYFLKLKKLSNILLVSVPLIDVLLLAATTIDLSRGAVATFAHGLAAAYLGFSVAFGSLSIRWADRWFAFISGQGDRPPKPATHGRELIRYEFILWLRCVLAVVVTLFLVFLAIVFIDDPVKSKALEAWFSLPLWVVAPWFIFGPLWVVLFKRSPR